MTGLPEKFEHALRTQLGDAFDPFAASLQQPAPVSIRMHPLKDNNFSGMPSVPWSNFGRYLDARPIFTLDPLFHGGSYYVQEASSMFVEQALTQTSDLSKPLKVLDLCAAPGGKSTHILSLLNRDSLLVSNEVIRSRASILSENIQKWGYPNAIVTNNDPADFQRLRGFFDVMVVDAPCSGEGLFRKDPDAAKEWSPENIQLCCSRQKRILADSWDALRENGILIYCTCTYNRHENEETLQWLKEQYSLEFIALAIEPSWGIQEVEINGVAGYRFFPDRVRGEGFFISVMRKRERVDKVSLKSTRKVTPPSKKVGERLAAWITRPAESAFYQFNDLIFFSPRSASEEFEYLLQSMKIVYAGTNMATLKHDKLIPEHALALSTELNKMNFPAVSVSESDALKYLRKETLEVTGQPPGFTLLLFQDLPLGWVNVLPNRINNMYPSEWRIRMRS